MDGYDAHVDEDTPVEIEPVYANVYAYVEGFVLPMFRRNPRRYLWAPNWYDYPEVVDRFEALWRAWEWDRLPDKAGMTGMAAFWKDTFDPMIEVITAPDGPFWQLTTKKYDDHDGTIPPVLASTPVPDELRRTAG